MYMPPVLKAPSVMAGSLLSSTRAFQILDAIHQCENPRNSEAPGRRGELGPYQMTLDTWRMHTLLPFTPRYACDQALAQSIALKHLRWIERHLMEHSRPVTVFEIAVAWNGGLREAYFPETAPVSVLSYALRVEDLANHPSQ